MEPSTYETNISAAQAYGTNCTTRAIQSRIKSIDEIRMSNPDVKVLITIENRGSSSVLQRANEWDSAKIFNRIDTNTFRMLSMVFGRLPFRRYQVVWCNFARDYCHSLHHHNRRLLSWDLRSQAIHDTKLVRYINLNNNNKKLSVHCFYLYTFSFVYTV